MAKSSRAPSSGRRSAEGREAAVTAPPSYTIANSIAHQVRTTHRCFVEAIRPMLARYGLTMETWYALRSLWEEDGLTPTDIAHRVGIEARSVAEPLQTLEAKGLIVRRRDPADRRKTHLFLTEAGNALKAQLTPLIPHMNTVALRGLNAGEIGFLRLALSRVRANLMEAAGDSWPVEPTPSPPVGVVPKRRRTPRKS